MKQQFIKYQSNLPYSYVFGAFGTIELLKNKPEECLSILITSSFKKSSTYSLITSLTNKNNIPLICDDKIVNKIKDKDNIFVIGIFKKYHFHISNNKHLVLCDIDDVGLIGTIIRSMRGFDMENLVLVNCPIDIFDEHLIRSTMGAFFSTNIILYDNLNKYLLDFKDNIFYNISSLGQTYKEIPKKSNISLIFSKKPIKSDNVINIEFNKDLSLDNIVNIILFNLYD